MAASAAAVSVFSLLSVLYLVIGPVKVNALHCYCALGEAPDCTAVEERINGAVNALFTTGCLRDCSQHNCMMAWYTFTFYIETCPIPINFQTSDYPVGVSRRSYNPICKHCTTVGNPVCPPPAATNVTIPVPTTPPTSIPTIPVAPAAPAPPSVPPSRPTIVVPVPVQSVPVVVPVLPSVPLTVPVPVSMPVAPVSAVLAPTNGPATASVGAPVMSLPAAGGSAAAVASASRPPPSASAAAPSLAMGAPASAQSQEIRAQKGRALTPLNAGSNAHSVFVPKSLISLSAVFITMLLFHAY
eukprot:TRINITY_DN222_c0_g1_i3.p1 TRINITY_DN222_c0_g1~~TRINITY_DN222_c0_g1_i3.p1  ORF type:complete len:317 (+),score=7.40 TRINITY_DN222_c0_g1_i3:55-951(+)